MATIDLTTWGISETNTPFENSCIFNNKNVFDSQCNDCCTDSHKLEAGNSYYLPEGRYKFTMMYIANANNVDFYGDTDSSGEPTTIIEFIPLSNFWNESTFLRIANTDGFNIHDLEFDCSHNNMRQGGIWAESGSKNGIIKNVRVYDPGHQAIHIGPQHYSSTPNVYNITVENCEVHGQRKWVGGTSKASIIAAGGADNITFLNCTVYADGKYKSTVSPANMFGSDNATNVEFRNCNATGSNQTSGSTTGFWVEGANQSDATLYNCNMVKTDGGLGASEGNTAIAHSCSFTKANNNSSNAPWSAWTHGANSVLELYNCTFDDCYHPGANSKGGVLCDAGSLTVEDSQFENTDGGENVSFYSGGGGSVEIEATLKNNTFDRGAKGYAGAGSGNIYLINNTLGPNANIVKAGNYTWIQKKSATTTAINSPTSDTTVFVSYGGHNTSVQYYGGGMPLGNILNDMKNAINNDSNAHITAEIDTDNNTITFMEKQGASGSYVNIQIDFNDWQNGQPFSDMNPSMQ